MGALKFPSYLSKVFIPGGRAVSPVGGVAFACGYTLNLDVRSRQFDRRFDIETTSYLYKFLNCPSLKRKIYNLHRAKDGFIYLGYNLEFDPRSYPSLYPTQSFQ